MGDRTTESTRNEKERKDQTVKKKDRQPHGPSIYRQKRMDRKKRENEKGEKKERDSNDGGGKTLF